LKAYFTEGSPSPQYFNNKVTVWRTFMNRCRDWEVLPYGEPHAAQKIKKRKVPDPIPEIYTVEQGQNILDLLRAKAPKEVPFFAIGSFSGVRPDAELPKLCWEHILFEKDQIWLPVEVAGKTSLERYVPLHPNLKKILVPYRQESGKVCTTRSQRNTSKLIREHGFEWLFDGMRHSYITYRIPILGSIEQVANEAGNSAAVVRKRYRRAMLKEEGVEWFNIV